MGHGRRTVAATLVTTDHDLAVLVCSIARARRILRRHPRQRLLGQIGVREAKEGLHHAQFALLLPPQAQRLPTKDAAQAVELRGPQVSEEYFDQQTIGARSMRSQKAEGDLQQERQAAAPELGKLLGDVTRWRQGAKSRLTSHASSFRSMGFYAPYFAPWAHIREWVGEAETYFEQSPQT